MFDIRAIKGDPYMHHSLRFDSHASLLRRASALFDHTRRQALLERGRRIGR